AEDGIRDPLVTGVQTCALPILGADDPMRAVIVAGLATAVQESGLVHESVPLYEEAIAGLDAQGAEQTAAHACLELARALWNIGRSEERRVGKARRSCDWQKYRA